MHPETGEPITVQDGRYGPYVKMGSESRSLANYDQMATTTLDEAVELLRQPKGSRRRAATVLAEVGTHPTSGAPLQVKTGRYGPYVTDGTVNATIPKGKDPKSITRNEAVELIRVREEKLKDAGKAPRARAKKRGAKASKRAPTKSGRKKAATRGRAGKRRKAGS